MYWKKREIVDTNIDPKRKYTESQLADIADELLRQDSRTELCRTCGERGDLTGEVVPVPQFDPEDKPLLDGKKRHLHIEFPEITCKNDHVWFQGEGSARGIGGDNPILFEEHFLSRRRREIYTSLGSPDPSIVQGIYNRSHPQGRKINSDEARKKHGASWYR